MATMTSMASNGFAAATHQGDADQHKESGDAKYECAIHDLSLYYVVLLGWPNERRASACVAHETVSTITR